MRSSATLKHTAIVFGATVVVNGANFAFHFGAVRLLGLATYSALAALLAVFLISSVPANVFQAVVATLVGEAVGTDEAGAAALGHTITNISLGAALTIALAGIFVTPWLANFLSIGDRIAVYFSFLSIALGFAVAPLRGLLQGQQRFTTFGISLICEATGNMVFGLGFVAFFHGLRFAVLGNACAIATAFIFTFAAVWSSKATEPVKLDLRRVVIKSLGTTIALATIAAMSWFDLVLVRHLTSLETAALYGALQFVGRTILFSVAFVPLVLLAKASKRKGENRESRSLLLPMIAIGLTICACELFTIRMAPETVVRFIAGARSVAAAPYLVNYAFALCALAMTTIVVSYGIGTHRFAFVAPLALIELGEIIGINLHHSTINEVISVIVIGHTAALLVTTFIVFLSGRLQEARASVLGQENATG